MKASEFIPGYASTEVKVESTFTDYELAVMEGGNSLEKPQSKSALRDVVKEATMAMRSNQKSITELFEPGKKWQWSFRGSEEAVAVFHVGEIPYVFHAYGTDGTWEVEFKRHGSKLDRANKFGLTGTGNSAEVMGTVVDIMRAFLTQYQDKIETLVFSAKEDSRQGLYAKMVKRLLPNWTMSQSGEEFVLVSPDSVIENFADGKVKGKSRPGRVKRAGASCSGSVTDLRQRAKNASGEKAKMYHWCANMKSGRAKNESEILEDLEEGWKDWVAGAALGAAALSPQAADAKSAPQQKPAITQQVQGNAEYATKLILKPEAKILIRTAQAAGMKGKELAQFVAQCAHETANFTSLKEFGGRLDFKKYDPKHNPRKAKILGNKQAGDGAKYHGRGYIQLTGRDNYKRAGQALGLPLESQPELVERPDVAAKVAVWFWQNQVAPKVSNFNDTAQVTKPINSGLKGLDDRHNKYASIMALMGRNS